MSIANPGLQLQGGVQPVNPRPVDTWSGPFYGTTVTNACAVALTSIPIAVRFPSMEVRLIANNQAYKYWFRNGITNSDLIEIAVAGATGFSGSTGFTGGTGATGFTGSTGATGTQGFVGGTGATGFVGGTGATGVQGFIGGTGATGIQGFIGGTGATGVQGFVGSTGATGIQGFVGGTGATGIQGFIGGTGATGIQGFVGGTGATGIQGFIGSTGATGAQGFTGGTGATGIQGFIGGTGATGIQGFIGGTGATGIQGFVGGTGATGIQGFIGGTGATGIQGFVGGTGATGVQGFVGGTGATGIQGFIGGTGATGVQGFVGGTGATGVQGFIGGTGATGPIGPSGATGPDFVFPSNLFVSLPGSKTFGRYVDGDEIPAAGLTPAQVIELAIVEAINPAVTLNTTPTTLAFNTTGVTINLSFSHDILSLNGTIATGILEFKRANQSTWTVLSTNVFNSPGTFTHTFNDTKYNTNALNYRYTVTDNKGGSTTEAKNVTIQSYAAPTGTLSVSGNILSYETNVLRERGKTQSILFGNITRNSVNVLTTNYRIQIQVNDGSWTTISSSSIPGGGSFSIPNYFDNTAANTSSSIAYRVQVDDEFQNNTTIYNSNTNYIRLRSIIFYGLATSAPTNSTQVRALTGRGFAALPGSEPGVTGLANPFILNTGNTLVNFAVAMPTPRNITLVRDLDASGANITSEYINNPFNVNDAGGSSLSYNVYTMTIAGPYSSNKQHEITRA